MRRLFCNVAIDFIIQRKFGNPEEEKNVGRKPLRPQPPKSLQKNLIVSYDDQEINRELKKLSGTIS